MKQNRLQEKNHEKGLSVKRPGVSVEPGVYELARLQQLARNPTTIGILELITGVTATVFDRPSNLILSGGRLTQSLFKGSFLRQLYDEVQKYRKEGKIQDENLNSSQGKVIFTELMRTIDEETIDGTKFEALKDIFLKSVWKNTDEHSQMLGYQYFQVCKKLSSIDILILKTAFNIYLQPGSNQKNGDIKEWEKSIATELGVPQELVVQSRLKNSGISQTPNTIIFDAENNTRHGLTSLGIAIGEYMMK